MAQQNHVEEVKTSLEIDEHLDMHKKGWMVQVFGLIFIFLVVVLAALGLFGDGILSTVKIDGADSKIEFDRFFRFEARMPIILEVRDADSTARVSFSNDYLREIKIENIVPEPKENEIRNGTVEYIFSLHGEGKIVFYVIPQQVGTLEGYLKVNESSYKLSHFIYP